MSAEIAHLPSSCPISALVFGRCDSWWGGQLTGGSGGLRYTTVQYASAYEFRRLFYPSTVDEYCTLWPLNLVHAKKFTDGGRLGVLIAAPALVCRTLIVHE
jgi:hypothetical protein